MTLYRARLVTAYIAINSADREAVKEYAEQWLREFVEESCDGMGYEIEIEEIPKIDT